MSIKEAAKVCEDCGVLKSHIRPSSFNVVKPDIFQFEINLNKSITVDGKKVKYDFPANVNFRITA